MSAKDMMDIYKKIEEIEKTFKERIEYLVNRIQKLELKVAKYEKANKEDSDKE